MAFSIVNTWTYLDQILKQRLSAKDSWQSLIDFLENQEAKLYWPSIKNQEIEKEVKELTEGLTEVFSQTPLPAKVVALWFGLTKFWDEENEQEFYVLYVTGSDFYSPDDIEWATQPVFNPDPKYLVSEVLNNVDALIRKDEKAYSFLDWILPLAFAAFTLNEILQSKLMSSVLLKFQSELHAVTGHDGGDFVSLSVITE